MQIPVASKLLNSCVPKYSQTLPQTPFSFWKSPESPPPSPSLLSTTGVNNSNTAQLLLPLEKPFTRNTGDSTQLNMPFSSMQNPLPKKGLLKFLLYKIKGIVL